METTLNIHAVIMEKLAGAARSEGVSCSELIIMLMKKTMKDMKTPARPGRMVRYQKKRMPGEWHRFHVYMREDEYEYLLDLRKLLKMSISLILAHSVQKYLDRHTNKNNTDNYQFRNYVVIREVVQGVVCWKFLWGFPPAIEKLLPLPGNNTC